MRHHDTTMVRRWWKSALAGFMALSVLAVVELSHCYAQTYYSGGFTPKHHPRSSLSQPSTPPTTTPAAPVTPPSYFPDNDIAYPSFYAGGESRRSLSSSLGGMAYGLLPADLPWNRADFEDYNEPVAIPQDPTPRQPKKYLLIVTPLAPAAAADRPENALLIARLPEHAVFWVEGTRTRSLGRTRYFQSPPLLVGQKYNYRVSVAWIENGDWVGQTRLVPVQAGLIQTIYLQPAPILPAKAAMNSLPK